MEKNTIGYPRKNKGLQNVKQLVKEIVKGIPKEMYNGQQYNQIYNGVDGIPNFEVEPHFHLEDKVDFEAAGNYTYPIRLQGYNQYWGNQFIHYSECSI